MCSILGKIWMQDFAHNLDGNHQLMFHFGNWGRNGDVPFLTGIVMKTILLLYDPSLCERSQAGFPGLAL
jgi:hypothetical protein